MNALNLLRRRRQPLGWVLASFVLISLASVLGQCLAAGAMPLDEAVPLNGGIVGEPSTMQEGMPCGDCAAGSGSDLLEAGGAALPGSLEPALVLALVVVSTLLALSFPRTIPIPLQPLLPRRPRTLKFVVLRI